MSFLMSFLSDIKHNESMKRITNRIIPVVLLMQRNVFAQVKAFLNYLNYIAHKFIEDNYGAMNYTGW